VEIKNEYRIVGKSMKGTGHLGDLGIDGMIILKSTSKKKALSIA
jgi:hypothetical protein